MTVKEDWANGDQVTAALLNAHGQQTNQNTTDIAGKQAADADLTAIAALAPADDSFMQRKSGAWAGRTVGQVKTDLAYTKSDIGLGNVDNTSDATKAASVTSTLQRKLLRRPLSNDVVAIGSSITERGVGGRLYPPWIGGSFMPNLCVESFQRLKYRGVWATGGFTITQVASTHLPTVLALNPAPGACFFVDSPSNDLVNGATLSATKSNLINLIVNPLLDAGILPILGTISNRYTTSPGSFTATAQKWNDWIRRYCSQNGFPCIVDLWTPEMQIDGAWVAACDSGDHTHPTQFGQRAVAKQAIADGIVGLFPPQPTNLTSRWSGDLSNLFNNGSVNYGLFQNDTNSDGIADGWSLSLNQDTTPSCALVAPTANDQLMGNWQEITRTTGDTQFVWLIYPVSGWSVGDTLQFAARVQTEGIDATLCGYSVGYYCFVAAGFDWPGTASNEQFVQAGLTSWTGDVDDGLAYVEGDVPSGTSQVAVSFLMTAPVNAGTAKVRAGEVTLRNLTTGGLL